MSIEGEQILAVTGVTAALEPGPIRVTQDILGKAFGSPGREVGLVTAMRRALKRFLAGGRDWPEPGDFPPFDYDRTLELLTEPMTDARLRENAAFFPDQALADDYMETLGTAIGYLQSILPLRVRQTLAGSTNVPPGDFSLSRFRRAYWVVDSPMVVLDDLASGLLLREQVDVMAKVYPELLAAARRMVLELIVEKRTASPTWEMPLDRERKLATFLGVPANDVAVRQAVRQAFAGAKAARPEQGPAAQSTPMKPEQPTQGQRLAEK